MKTMRWLTGFVFLSTALAVILTVRLPFLFYKDLPHLFFYEKALYVVFLAVALCLYRVVKGPTAADRIVAEDIMGLLTIGICCLLSITTGRSWYINVGIAWAIQWFIAVLALSKYLEGKGFDD